MYFPYIAHVHAKRDAQWEDMKGALMLSCGSTKPETQLLIFLFCRLLKTQHNVIFFRKAGEEEKNRRRRRKSIRRGKWMSVCETALNITKGKVWNTIRSQMTAATMY